MLRLTKLYQGKCKYKCKCKKDINVQNVMNESGARGEDDLGRREAEVLCF